MRLLTISSSFGRLLDELDLSIPFIEKREMARRKTITSIDPFVREESMVLLDKTINKGDIVKIQGVWGSEFRFVSLVTNPKNGAQWVDCVELERGVACGMRSFRPERVKLVTKRIKGVKRRRSRKASGSD